MTVQMENNGRGPDIDLDVSIDQDEDIALTVSAALSDSSDLELVLDYFTADPAEIEEFFRMVDQARERYEKLTG